MQTWYTGYNNRVLCILARANVKQEYDIHRCLVKIWDMKFIACSEIKVKDESKSPGLYLLAMC